MGYRVTRRLSLIAAVLVVIAGLGTAAMPGAAAIGAVAPVAGVVVRGTMTPSEVTVTWAPPQDAAYTGARVVVVPGTVASTDPADAAAVFRQDVASPAASVTWSTGTAGVAYSVSVFAYDASATLAAPAAASITLTGPIRHLVIVPFKSGDTFTAYFTRPAGADLAVLCHGALQAPVSPATADRGTRPHAYTATLDRVSTPNARFAVFALNSATGVYGPAVSAADGGSPAMPPEQIQLLPVDATQLEFLAFIFESPTDGGTGMGTGALCGGS